MLDVAESLTPLLKSRAARLAAGTPLLTAHLDELEAGETTLQLVFFDGEEAFHQWTRADSVYGSRHLAATWEDTLLPPHHPLARRRMAPTPNMLDTIDVLVLLDLLGAPGPRIQSYYRETDWLFEEMRSADTRLRAAGLVEGKEAGWFVDFRGYAGMIDDDHRPFLEKGVPVLHVIPNPFPHVWHKQFEVGTTTSARKRKRTRMLTPVPGRRQGSRPPHAAPLGAYPTRLHRGIPGSGARRQWGRNVEDERDCDSGREERTRRAGAWITQPNAQVVRRPVSQPCGGTAAGSVADLLQ